MVTGKDPGEAEIDHRNLDTKDNRWKNLRVATRSENQHNRKAYSNNKCGIKGVAWHKASKSWRGYVHIKGKQYYTKGCSTPEIAQSEILKKREELHGEFTNHG